MGVALHFAAVNLLDISFIEQLICGFFTPERKEVHRHLQPVAIPALKQNQQDTRKSSTILHNPAQGVNQNIYHDAANNIAKVARRIVLLPNTQHHVLVTTKSHRLLTIKPRAMRIGRHRTLAARKVKDISPNQPLYILISNFSDLRVCLPMSMIVAQRGIDLGAKHAVGQSKKRSFLNRKPQDR